VLAAENVAQLFDSDVQFHNELESDRLGGTNAVQAKIFEYTNRRFVYPIELG
jgi:hypothetical protein